MWNKTNSSKQCLIEISDFKSEIKECSSNFPYTSSFLKSDPAAAKPLQSCATLHRRQPTRLRRPWDSPGKNTGVGCHFLLQCMKVKSESEIAQSCPTLSDPMDCNLPGSSVHGIFQMRVLEWVAIAFSIYIFLVKISKIAAANIWLFTMKKALC